MAKLHFDQSYVDATINPLLWGSFTEHLGRCVYGGLYQPDHETADADGLRRDVVDEVRNLDISLVRYPGGNFVSNYDWKDGIGPRESRPTRLDFAWATVEPNLFGIDDFMKWAEAANVEPMIAVNLGTGTIKEAAEFVEYCNHPGGTYWSDLRRKNGREEPYGIKYWCLGNEMEGSWQAGHMSAEDYAAKALEAAKMMRWVDPTIKLVACGSSYHALPEYLEWDRIVLASLYPHVDYISTHFYAAQGKGPGKQSDQDFVASWKSLEEHIGNASAAVQFARAKQETDRTLPICLDEWNVWNFRDVKIDDVSDLLGKTTLELTSSEPWETAPAILQEDYTLLDALTFSGLGISLINSADVVEIACLAQLVNAIAPLTTKDDGGVLRRSTWYPLYELTKKGRGEVVRAVVEAEEIETLHGRVPALHSAVVKHHEDSCFYVFVLNAHLTDASELDVSMADSDITVTEHRSLFGPELRAANTFDSPDAVTMTSQPVTASTSVVLPPASFNVLRVEAN